MRSLTFEGEQIVAARRIREAAFEERSAFAVSAACLLANAMRDTLAKLFAAPVELRLLAPVIPTIRAWRTIAADAWVYRVAGTRCTAAILLKPPSALALAGAMFGEATLFERPLSKIEQAVVDRTAAALVPNFSAICGLSPDALRYERADDAAGFTTYLELLVERPVAFRLGIALGRDPAPDPVPALRAGDLDEVHLDVDVRTEGVLCPAHDLAAIELGDIVPITDTTRLTAVATIAGRVVGYGECGVRGNRLALAIGLSPRTDGGSEPEP